jgi:hypothetical protein
MREILADAGLPEPDEVEYGESSIWLRWDEQKLVIEINRIPVGDPEPPAPF